MAHRITSKVIRGDQRGKRIGFPTANLKLSKDDKLPQSGVYSGKAIHDNKTYYCMINLGARPTFDDNEVSLEVHILNFDKDIYDETLEIEFLDFIRPQKKFNSIQELIDQITQDINNINS